VPATDEDGNPSIPDNERAVLVFLCGDRGLLADRPDDAGWGERFGYFDHDKRAWRVGGALNSYVTHWMDLPAPPPTARCDLAVCPDCGAPVGAGVCGCTPPASPADEWTEFGEPVG
jgi:hypothetical protein